MANSEFYSPLPEVSRDGENWRKLGACADEDPELFFPIKWTDRSIAAAKAVCAVCTVRDPCLEEGLGNDYGIWGGMTEDERRGLKQIAKN